MTADIHPLLLTVSGWVSRQQHQVIEYLVEEYRVLREQLGDRLPRLDDSQRRRLAAKGKVLGRRLLQPVATIFTPDTILRWHRRLISAKWTYQKNRVGRPGVMKTIRALIIRFAKEESSCAYCRILFGEGHLRRALDQYLAHYHRERNHQGLSNELIEGCALGGAGEVVARERLGGLLRYYHWAA